MSKFKIVALVVVFICFVAVVTLTLHDTPKQPSPDFLVQDVTGQVKEPKDGWSFFMLSFKIQNNGTAIGSNVRGAVSFKKDNGWTSVDWNFFGGVKDVVGIDESCLCQAFFWDLYSVPSNKFLITISCDEGVTRDFNVEISL